MFLQSGSGPRDRGARSNYLASSNGDLNFADRYDHRQQNHRRSDLDDPRLRDDGDLL
jgi:hypothetical protein